MGLIAGKSQEIDINEWSIRCQPDQLDRMLRLLIGRSSGSLRELHVSRVNNDEAFDFIAQHAGCLQTLTLRHSQISDSIVEKVAGKLSSITSLDLSHSHHIGSRALEAIGKNCKLLSSLRWNMYLRHHRDVNYKPSHADEAHAIAKTMPKLKQLELTYLLINFDNVLEILSGCSELESLDLRGCWGVHLDKEYLEKRHPKVNILGPHSMEAAFRQRVPHSDDCDCDIDY